MHLEAIGGELARDDVGGARFVERQFGMGVEVAAKGDEVGEKIDVQKGHCGRFESRVLSL